MNTPSSKVLPNIYCSLMVYQFDISCTIYFILFIYFGGEYNFLGFHRKKSLKFMKIMTKFAFKFK